MALHLPVIYPSPSNQYQYAQSKNLSSDKPQFTTKFNYQPSQPLYPDTKEAQSPKKILPLRSIPSLNLGLMDGSPSHRPIQAELSPTFNPNFRAEPRSQVNNNLMFMPIKKPMPTSNGESPMHGNKGLMRLGTLELSARQPSSEFYYLVLRHKGYARPMLGALELPAISDRGTLTHLESPVKKMYPPPQKPVSMFEDQLDQPLEKQTISVERFTKKIEASQIKFKGLNQYKADLDSQIRRLQEKKEMVARELERQTNIRNEPSIDNKIQKDRFKPADRLPSPIPSPDKNRTKPLLDDIDMKFNLNEGIEARQDKRYIPVYKDKLIQVPGYLKKDDKNKSDSPEPGQGHRKLKTNGNFSVGALEEGIRLLNREPEEEKGYNEGGKQSWGTKLLENYAKKHLKERNTVEIYETEEDKRENKTDKKTNTRIRALMWLVLTFQLSWNEKKNRASEKKDNLETEVISKIVPNSDVKEIKVIKNYILKVAGKDLEAMLTNKQNSFVFVSTKAIPGKKMDKEYAALRDQFKVVLDKMKSGIATVPDFFFRFLKKISEEESLLPGNFFSEFELNRLQFNYFGCLKNVQPAQSKLIIGGIALVRVLIHSVIMQSNDTLGIGQDKYNLEKVFNISSVLYNAAMETLRGYGTPQSNQKAATKVQPRKKPLLAITDAHAQNTFNVWKDMSRDGEIINGFYSKMQLSSLFSDRKDIALSMKTMMQEWIDTIYQITRQF